MIQIKTMLFVFVLFGVQIVYGQGKPRFWKGKIPEQVCYASGKSEKSFVPPPKEFLLKSDGVKKSEIIVDYSLFPQDAKDAFEYAVGVWETVIESDIPIHIQAFWRTQSKNTLGSAGPTDFVTDFDFIPHEGRFYPIALAEKISRKNINSENTPDIKATFNKTQNWYFGTDGNTPDELMDFVSVVMHEIGHGLGFIGFFYVNQDQDVGLSSYEKIGDATGFDLLVTNFGNEALIDTSYFENPSFALKEELESGRLYANSHMAKRNNKGIKPRLYAPGTYDDGSSISHLNEFTYSTGTINSLMTPFLSKGEAVHDPGPITEGILDDAGWSNVYIKFKKLKDIETTQPINFMASVTSDYLLDTASIYAIYSYDNFENHRDSVPLTYTDSAQIFEGILAPPDTIQLIHYYIQAGDTTNRIFTMPSEAPRNLYTLTIAPDNQIPEIGHSPIPYFILNEDFLTLNATADDNIGVDTVYVEYSINGEQQASFGLKHDTLHSYSAIFNFDINTLKDGDVIAYKIVARDSSKAKNIALFPTNDNIEFKIEEIFDPVESYYTDFNKTTSDFLITDFDIYKEEGFENGALHSFHPYPSPNDNDLHFDFITILKRPIILSEGASMSFDEIVLVEPGELYTFYPNEDFYDYVVVEGSSDRGKTWKALAPGYDCTDNETWETLYNENIDENDLSTNKGNPDIFINRQIDLLNNGNFNAGDTILVQFRLYSDPFATGWGWTIDNLRIQQPVSADLIHIRNPVIIYPNPFSNELNLSFESQSLSNKIEVEIINLFGQKVYHSAHKQFAGRFNEVLNLNGLNGGIYVLSVKENGKIIFNKKVIKRH